MATTSIIAGHDGPIPPYLPFKTFQSAVQNLRTHGLPSKLDRTAWNTQSGGIQKQIIAALKFLGLIDDSETTQPSLKRLVDVPENSGEEKAVISSLLKEHYPNLFNLDLKAATLGQIQEAIESMGVTGATRDRAARFFMKAAHFSGIELSSRLIAGMRSISDEVSVPGAEENEQSSSTTQSRTRRRRRVSTAAQSIPHSEQVPDDQLMGKAVRTVSLRNVEGELTLSGTFNPFELDGEERKLVYDIIDLMKAYAQKKTASE